MNNIVFYAIAGIVVAAGLLSLTVRNLFHCALFLALTMFGISGVFLYLNSDFLAGVQVLIYVGAVTVIIIFGISLTRNMMDERTTAMNRQFLFAILGAVFVTAVIFAALQQSTFLTNEHPMAISLGTATTTGDVAQTTTAAPAPVSDQVFQSVGYLADALILPQNGFAFAFEFVSILLLSALVGAIVIARKDPA
jgi:NADH:ubiquinone oxidoreductase subunit 6 (subunit J)